MFRELLKSVFRLTSSPAFRFVTLFGGARPMNEGPDVTELDEAVERLRRGYQKPLFPLPTPLDRQTANGEDAVVERDSAAPMSPA
jgi:hypothetical protein